MNPNHPSLVSPPRNLQARFRWLRFAARWVGTRTACLILGLAALSQTAHSQPALVGQWFTNNTLADVSAYTPAGTHDGYDIAGTGSYVFTNDVPPNKTGQSLLLFNGDTGIAIANSSTSDGAYTNTFDEGLTNAMTVALWAKGWPSGWSPFVSKFGEGPGWQLRNDGNNNVSPCWTVRGIGPNSAVTLGTAVYGNPEDLAATGFTFGNDGAWHLYVGTFDAATGIINLYVDGALGAASVSNGVYNISSDSRLCIGARDTHGTPGNYFTGEVYDVRVYNYAVSAATVLDWYGVISPTVNSQPKSVGVFNGSAAQFTASASGTPPLTYQWQLNGTNVNLLPDSANFTGATSNKLTVLSVSTNDVGSYQLVVTSTLGYGTATSSNASLNIVQKSLVGQWFTNGTLNDLSGYTPAGTHDGYAVGGGNYSFTADVPPGESGQSLSLPDGDSAIAITNSSTGDGTYTNTFEQNTFTVAFWAKGRGNGGQWDEWASKGGYDNNGEYDGIGWDVGTEAYSQFLYFDMEGIDQGGITYTLGDGLWGNTILECNPKGLPGEDVNWHHYAATYSVDTGIRRTYFDGVLVAQQNGCAQYFTAAAQHFIIGGMEQKVNGLVAFTTSSMYDVRFYNYDLTASQVSALLPNPYISVQPFQSRNAYVGVTAYIGATVTTFGKPTTNQWQLNGTNLVDGPFGGAIISGATSSSTLTIANMTTNLAGVYSLVVSYAGGLTISSNATLTVLQTAPIPTTNLVGAWLTGATNLADSSGYQPAGTHDGYGVINDGTAGTNFVFTNDVPPGTTGHSLWLEGNTGIAISNSCDLDVSYTNTFDDTISTNGMTVVCWAKGLPGGWNPWVSKYGESGQGWQLRVNGDGATPCWTIRGPGGDDMSSTIGKSDGAWHNYTGTYDPIAGVRNLYVDGVLAATESGQGALNEATSSHLAIGAKDSGGNNFGSYFTGEIYGVRIYDAAFTEAQVNYLLLPAAPPAFSRPPVLNGNNLVITWTGGSLLQATNIAGPWTPTGATSPFTNNVTTYPQMFYRVSNR